MVRNRFNGKLRVKNGPFKHWPHQEGVMMVQGGPVYEKGIDLGRLCRLDATDRVPEDGYYKIRFKGGADRGDKNEPITVKIRYGGKLPIETWAEIPVTASADDPAVHEATVFLLRGAADMKRRLEFFWNDERKHIVTSEFGNLMFRTINGTVSALSKGKAAGTLSAAEEAELQAKLADARRRADAWQGPAMVLNPKREVRRLLADPKAREFVENFAGQWLSVREFGTVMPARQYADYDAELEAASKEEVYAFFNEVLTQDLPVTSFLDSDFLVINERLARHYEIDGVAGKHFRRVALAPQHNRGGIFGMAGLMTLLADGTRTLPVRRAAWIRENLFNDPPPPPPPNAGEVQPNTRGEKLTVRERLERHRNEPTCASCHAPLDPYGLALENYDAIGQWRTHQNGEDFKGRKRPDLDVSGRLPSGREFATLAEFKAALLAEKDAFARAFSERLLTYALTRPVGYVDHQTVDGLVAALRGNGYRIRPLIEAVVLSEAFRSK